MKIKFINNNFDFKKKTKFIKNSPTKLVLTLSLTLTLALTGCSSMSQFMENTNIFDSKTPSTPSSSNTTSSALESTSDSNKVNEENSSISSSVNPASSSNQVVSSPSITETSPTESKQKQEKKLVAITFDDGPSKYTSELVDILSDNNANATFFLIGSNINKYSDSVVKAYKAGNEIGIHGYSHTSFTKMTISQIKDELDKTEDLLNGIDVKYDNIVRPPYGSINKDVQNGIDTSFILWNVDTRDWESRNTEEVIKQVKANISEGDIVLFHDIYPTTIEAIKEVLPQLTDEYEFVTVSQLFSMNGKTLEDNQKYFELKK